MKRKGNVLLLIFVMMASLLAACGGGTNANESKSGADPAPAPAPAAAEPQKPVNTGPREITMYTAGGTLDQKGFDDMYGNAIRKKFPDVTVKYIPNGAGTKIQDIIASGTTVDIVFDSIGYAQTFRSFDLQVDMTPFIASRKLDLSKFEQSTIDFQRKLGNGKLYSLPVWTASAGLYYNKDIFDKFGVAYPKDNMTWDQIYDIAKQLTRQDGGIQYVGYVTAPASQANTNQLGLKFVDPKTGKAQLESEGWKKFMQSIVQFYQIPGMTWTSANIATAPSRAMFEKDRTAAMYTNFSGGTPPDDMNWDVVNVPHYPEAPGVGAQSYPAYLSLTKLSKNPELAFDVITYLVSEEYQTENTRLGRATVLNRPDILKQYGDALPKFKGKNISAMFPTKRAELGEYNPEYSIGSKHFNNAFNAIILEKKDINTALREANEAANKEIEALKAQQK